MNDAYDLFGMPSITYTAPPNDDARRTKLARITAQVEAAWAAGQSVTVHDVAPEAVPEAESFH